MIFCCQPNQEKLTESLYWLGDKSNKGITLTPLGCVTTLTPLGCVTHRQVKAVTILAPLGGVDHQNT